MTLAFALAIATLHALPASAAGLGDPVPNLSDQVRWLKGEPVPAFEPGQVYVLEFWATWCPPCFVEMPHFSELARDYRDRDVTVIGLAVGADMGQSPATFMARHGDRMDYAVAQEVTKGRLEELYLPEGQDINLPLTLIIDRDGRLAWRNDFNDPTAGLEEAMERIVSGAHDAAALAAVERLEVAKRRRAGALLDQAKTARVAGRVAAAAELLQQVVAIDAALFGVHAVEAFELMLCGDSPDPAYAFARDALESGVIDDPHELGRLGRAVLHVPGVARRDYDLARTAARLANEARGGDHPDFLFEAAKIEQAFGDAVAAKAFQARAVEAARKQDWMPSYIAFIGSRFAMDTSMRSNATTFRATCGEAR